MVVVEKLLLNKLHHLEDQVEVEFKDLLEMVT
jgi:hypothetical protein